MAVSEILLDDSVLSELLEVAQFALNDDRVIKRVAVELGFNSERVEALAGLAVEISNTDGSKPSITTAQDIDVFTSELAALKAEFEPK